MRFALAYFEEEKDPDKAMNVLQALHWGIAAWREGITDTTIANCWVQSRVLGPKYGPINRFTATESGWQEAIDQDNAQIQETEAQIGASIQKLADQERIHSKMNISAFLNPVNELVDDEDEEILQDVVDSYTEGDRMYETDEEEPPEVPRVHQQEAIDALQLLQRYEEQQEDGDSEVLRRLAQLEITVKGRVLNSLQQTQITSYLT